MPRLSCPDRPGWRAGRGSRSLPSSFPHEDSLPPLPHPGPASSFTGDDDAALSPWRIIEPGRALNLALPRPQGCAAAARQAWVSVLPSTSGAEGEGCGFISASRNRKPSCLRAYVIAFHIKGPCSHCQKRPPALRGSGHQVLPLNHPLWRTRGPEVPGALSLRALPGKSLPMAASVRRGTSLCTLPFPAAGEAPEKNPPSGRPPPSLVIKLLSSAGD